MEFKRFYENLNDYLEIGRALLIMGPRRVGKTTLVTKFYDLWEGKKRLITGDNIEVQNTLGSSDFDKIFRYVEDLTLLVIDEAQMIPNIGMGIKILVDHKPELMIIATGSSSFELAGQVGEPLVGRKWELKMFPISILELISEYSHYEIDKKLDEILIFGTYPSVLSETSFNKKIEILDELKNSYLFKDILAFQEVKGADVLLNILKLLAFQIGSEVSLTEIATQVGIDYKTVARYLDLFEKSYIIFRLNGYSKNLRKEVTAKSKYYFYDNGLRNAIISQFNALEDRNDIGQLWENFLVSERLKKVSYQKIFANNYFWRTWDQKEIDWVEEKDGKLFGFEFKYKEKRLSKSTKAFTNEYDADVKVINKENYLDFVG